MDQTVIFSNNFYDHLREIEGAMDRIGDALEKQNEMFQEDRLKANTSRSIMDSVMRLQETKLSKELSGG